MKAIALLIACMATAPSGAPLDVAGVEDAPPGARLSEPTQGFVVDLAVEPLAGQQLDAGTFRVEFLIAPPEADRLLANGFETP